MFSNFLILASTLLSFQTISAVKLPTKHSKFEQDKRILTSQEKLNKFDDEPGPDYRLPTCLIPQNYSIRIRPIIDGDYPGIGDVNTAESLLQVRVKCVETTNKVVMHQKSLKINESFIGVTQLGSSKGEVEVIKVSGVEYDETRDFMTINLEGYLTPPNFYEISIGYRANVPPNNTLRGLYSEKYFDPLTNQTKVIGVTQLEPLRARQVFPCFDEPTYKARFDVIIGRTENFTSLGNSPLIGTQPDTENPGWFWDTFDTTVPMPTYLFAMAVSDYSFNEASSELYRLPVRIYGPRHLTNAYKAQISADSTAMLMDHYEQRFGIPHNMPKVDSVSVPLKLGAMENYGLITYGEHYLMIHEGITLDTELRQIYHILAHELGHQWFGNMVTCKWWSDIWLNEGFANYVSYEGVQALWPRFDMMNYMVHEMVSTALRYDAGPSSHPVHMKAYNAKQVFRNMDTIGYDKGGSLVRLMVSFLGEDTFYSGIRSYLERLEDQVAEQDDLFEALNDAVVSTGLNLPNNVTEIMNTWTLQKGFPLVRVDLNEDNNSLVFSQKPWQNADVRNNESNVTPDSVWDIPVKYLADIGQDEGQEGNLWLLSGDEVPKNVTIQTGSGWILTNPDAGGYYRTLYDDILVKRIAKQLEKNHSVFPVSCRIRLLDDQWTLGVEKYIPIQNGLELTKYLLNETDPNVWFSVLSNLNKLRMFWGQHNSEDQGFEALQIYLLPRIETIRKKISLNLLKNPLESSAESILHSQLVDWSCFLNSDWCNEYTRQLFHQWQISDSNPVPINLQSPLYCKMADIMGKIGYLFILEQYQKAGQTRIQKSRLGPALGCATYDTFGSMMLAFKRKVDSEEAVPLLQRVLEYTSYGRFRTLVNLQLARMWIKDYGWTVEEFVDALSSTASNYFSDISHVAQTEAAISKNSDIFGDSLNSTIAQARANVVWLGENSYNITSFFHANSPEK